MTPQKHAIGGEMPGFEGMGKMRTGIMVVVIVVLALVAIGAMVKGLDSAHGGVVAAAPAR
jgi:hypothetical protein